MRSQAGRLGSALLFGVAATVATVDARADGPAPAPDVTVDIVSSDDVDLEKQEGSSWKSVCKSPCHAQVPADGNYRINGFGIRTSSPFRLQPASTIKLNVETSSSIAHTTGIVLIVVGGVGGLGPAAAVTGALVIAEFFGVILVCPLVDALSKTSYGGCLGDIGSGVGTYYGKPYVWGPLLVGLVLVLGGGIMAATTPPSNVVQSVVAPAAPAPTTLPITRAPIETNEWKLDDSRFLPPAAIAPLYTTRF
jgi:hypothetical protein